MNQGTTYLERLRSNAKLSLIFSGMAMSSLLPYSAYTSLKTEPTDLAVYIIKNISDFDRLIEVYQKASLPADKITAYDALRKFVITGMKIPYIL